MSKQNNEKSAILSVVVFIALVLFVYLCHRFTSSASLYLLGIIAVIAEYVIIMPLVNKLYHEYHEMEAPITRYIPVYNELMLFSGWVYTSLLILTGIFVVVVICASPLITYLPFSPALAVRITSYGLYFAVFLFIVICIIRGIGFCSIKHEADMSILEVFEKSPGAVGYFLYVTLFVPIVRCIGLAYMLSDFKRLSLNDISSDFEAASDDDEDLYEYEE